MEATLRVVISGGGSLYARGRWGPRLRRGGRLCFSETAGSRDRLDDRSPAHAGRHPRSGGRHLEAVRRLDRVVALAVVGGRLADDLAEGPAEGPQAAEADVEADLGDAPVRLPQEEQGPLHPPPLQVAMGRFAEAGPEAAAEVGLREAGHGGHGRHVERLRIGPIHGIAGAQEPAVEVLDVLAHEPTLRHEGWPCAGRRRVTALDRKNETGYRFGDGCCPVARATRSPGPGVGRR